MGVVEELHFGLRETGAAFLTAAGLSLAAASLVAPSARAQEMPEPAVWANGSQQLGPPHILYAPSGPVDAPMALASLGAASTGRTSPPQRLERAGANPAPTSAAARTPLSQVGPSDPSIPSVGPLKIGAPYQVNGVWYIPAHEPDYDEDVVASWYGGPFHGKLTANGELYDQFAMTGAHPTLPLPSLVDVTNLENGRRVIVRLNDRGPFVAGRSLDLSQAAALALGMRERGTARMRVRYIGPGTTQGSDERLTAHSGAVAGLQVSQPRPTVLRAPDEGLTASSADALPSRRDGEPAFAQVWPGNATISAAPLAPPSVPSAGYFVQVGAFAAAANAERARAGVSAVGSVTVRSAVVNGATLYRVVLGPWSSPDGAQATLTRLSAMGHSDARIVMMPPPSQSQ
jgi:rare lipoprotein A